MTDSIPQVNEPRPSAFAEVRALGLRTVIRLAVVTLVLWLIFSIGAVWLLVSDRRRAFESIVKSHQEDIANGVWRDFFESMSRGDLSGITNVKICWGKVGDQDPSCTATASEDSPLIAVPIRIKLKTGSTSTKPPTVYADLSLMGPIGVSATMMLLLILLGLAWLSSMRELYSKTSQAQQRFAKSISDAIQSGDQSMIEALPSELRPLSHALIKTLEDLQTTENEKKVAQAVWKVASQVAHDIRSPLAALEMIVRLAESLPEGERFLVRNAAGRIRDIANQLLAQNALQIPEKPAAKDGVSTELLLPLIESAVSEKRVQYRERSEIIIEAEFSENARGAFARVNPVEFRVILSNIMNNAVEAIEKPQGKVTIRTILERNQIFLAIEDNGKGIPTERLPEVGVRGASFGKEGTGLGLSHAKESLLSWGGNLQITSQAGIGTSVLLSLPQAAPPKWFLSQLPLFAGSIVAVLDDDASIHGVWKSRLSGLDIELVDFYDEKELATWINANPILLNETTFLMDCELRSTPKNGLDLIEVHGLSNRAILITSHAEEADVQQRCAELGVKLLPKSLAAFVPIEFNRERLKIDAVLIDNDDIVHLSWENQAVADEKRVRLFRSSIDFLSKMESIPMDTPICVDADLGAESGLDVIKTLRDRGYSLLYITTGHSAERFKDVEGIQGVIDKRPLWVQLKGA